MKNLSFPRTLLGAACAATILAACGGGGGATAPVPVAPAPVPAPVILGNPTVSGTITGFGSVIVDGVRIDDKAVAAGKEKADGTITAAELKIGQHVEVEHDGNRVATKIRVNAEVEGSVSAVDLAAKTLTVLGQTVSINTDAALGPVTVFGAPYTKLDDVKAADAVEIHALIKTDAAGKMSLQATRIEKKGVDIADRVNGVIFDLSATAHTFKIGSLLVDYSSATLMPAGAVLANGSEVTVAIPVGTVEKGVAVKASAIKVKDRKAESQGKEVELGGAVSAFDTAKKILTVNGVKVDVSAISFNQPGKTLADLKPGAYLVIKGTYGSRRRPQGRDGGGARRRAGKGQRSRTAWLDRRLPLDRRLQDPRRDHRCHRRHHRRCLVHRHRPPRQRDAGRGDRQPECFRRRQDHFGEMRKGRRRQHRGDTPGQGRQGRYGRQDVCHHHGERNHYRHVERGDDLRRRRCRDPGREIRHGGSEHLGDRAAGAQGFVAKIASRNGVRRLSPGAIRGRVFFVRAVRMLNCAP